MGDVSTGRQRCAGTRKDGSPCGGYAVGDSGILFQPMIQLGGCRCDRTASGWLCSAWAAIGAVGEHEPVRLATWADVLGCWSGPSTMC